MIKLVNVLKRSSPFDPDNSACRPNDIQLAVATKRSHNEFSQRVQVLSVVMTSLCLYSQETLLPPEEELQSSLQDFVDWKAHRARVYKRLVTDKQSRSIRHQQFPPQFRGQYSFRTGPTVRTD